MTECFFVSNLHGRADRYGKLFDAVADERPRAVFVGGDILPHFAHPGSGPDFLWTNLLDPIRELRSDLGPDCPRFLVIMGNDDPRVYEETLEEGQGAGLLSYMHMKREPLDRWTIYGYSMTPPSPFRLKDWERYDVARYVDPGAVSPEEGARSVEVDPREIRYGTIADDLDALAGRDDLSNAVMLFHAPPYGTSLDRAPLDGRTVDHVPLDVHIGSQAIARFIEKHQPLVTLHGHAHESARLTGAWRQLIGRTLAISAAHDGPELALVRFALENPGGAKRDLI